MLTESWHISMSRSSTLDIIIIACRQIPINRKCFSVRAAVIKFHFLTQSQVAASRHFLSAPRDHLSESGRGWTQECPGSCPG